MEQNEFQKTETYPGALKRVLFFVMLLMAVPATADVARKDLTTGTLLGDARKIIASEVDDIRIWGRRPRVLILSTDARVRVLIEEIRDTIDQALAPESESSFFASWEYIDIVFDWDVYPRSKVELSMVRQGMIYGSVHVGLASGYENAVDIVVVVGDRKTIAVFNELWGLNPAFAKYQADGRPGGCFIEAASKYGVRQGVYISIVPPRSKPDLYLCLWEEFLHALGPLQDAHKSQFFSFDDYLRSSSEKRMNDILLIRALYESGAGPGGSPDVVIEYLRGLLGE